LVVNISLAEPSSSDNLFGVVAIGWRLRRMDVREISVMKYAVCLSGVIAICFLSGCNSPTILPNSDPYLRKTSTQFAADAAKRHPFKTDAPRGGEALATATYNLTFSTLAILNYSDEDWTDVEVWVNEYYMVFLGHLGKGNAGVETIPFAMLFDDSGNAFWTDNGKNPIKTVEIYRKGKMYTVPVKLGE